MLEIRGGNRHDSDVKRLFPWLTVAFLAALVTFTFLARFAPETIGSAAAALAAQRNADVQNARDLTKPAANAKKILAPAPEAK